MGWTIRLWNNIGRIHFRVRYTGMLSLDITCSHWLRTLVCITNAFWKYYIILFCGRLSKLILETRDMKWWGTKFIKRPLVGCTIGNQSTRNEDSVNFLILCDGERWIPMNVSSCTWGDIMPHASTQVLSLLNRSTGVPILGLLDRALRSDVLCSLL